MKFIEEYRQEETAQHLVENLRRAVSRPWTIMEVCGGQTHTILQYGIENMIPPEINLVHGPGCPICVTPVEMVDKAIAIAGRKDVIFSSFGDMLRVPGSRSDLLDAKARGADVRIVYSPLDAVNLAQSNPSKKVVFFAVGFETTAPANAMALAQAKRLGLDNFFVLCSHVTVPPMIAAILQSPGNQVQAFLGPGHVCSVMGASEYEGLSRHFKVPIVITGFEPVDILDGILHCVLQLESGAAHMENRYARAVRDRGNLPAQSLLAEVFDVADRPWRGLGMIPKSGYKLSHDYRRFDAEIAFEVDTLESMESPVCISGQILRGVKKPTDCPAFGCQCTPENPLGATMVSTEGTCASYYKFNRHQETVKQ
jgi:hydrogenase expression/formation protein HypD